MCSTLGKSLGCWLPLAATLAVLWGAPAARAAQPDRFDEVTTWRLASGARRGIAAAGDGRVYAVGDQLLLQLDDQGREVSRTDLAAPAGCVAVDAAGRVYLGHGEHVEVRDAEGERVATWTSLGERAVITSIAVTEVDVFVADAGNRVVMRFDKTGALLAVIGRKDKAHGVPGLIAPSPYMDVAVAHDGRLWVVNPGRRLVEVYSLAGERLGAWGRSSMRMTGFCGCCNPTHMALTPDGSFVTSEKGLCRVKVYDSSGRLTGVVADEEAFKEGTVGLDLAVLPDGRVLVLDPECGAIRVFEREGASDGR